jgi:hypothetical protein
MNQEEFKALEEKRKLRENVIAAAEGFAITSFRYYRDQLHFSPESLEDQVLRVFRIGQSIGEKIGRGEL